MDAIVLAGGLGTRLRSVVTDVPKPMAPVNGRPFLELLLSYWIAQGVRRFVLSIGYLAERITSHFGDSWRGAEIAYARETHPLGTGGGLLLALEQARSNDVLVLNGDTFFAVELGPFAALHKKRTADCSISLYRSHDTKRYLGIALDADGRVISLGAEAGSKRLLINGGVYLFRTAALHRLPWRPGVRASVESDVLPHGLHSGWRIYGRQYRGAFIDIGVPQDYARASKVLGV